MEHTVLLVDDEANILAGLKRTLRHEPYTVIVATSGAEALQTMKETCVDVIVADQKMPMMSGTELLAAVRREHPYTMRVILTGHANVEDAIQAINEGEVYRYLTKPADPVELTVTIRQALQQRQLMKGLRRLVRTVGRQSAVIEEIERVNPGITRMRTTPNGTILVENDLPEDFDTFMKEVNARAEFAEQILDTSP